MWLRASCIVKDTLKRGSLQAYSTVTQSHTPLGHSEVSGFVTTPIKPFISFTVKTGFVVYSVRFHFSESADWKLAPVYTR